MDKILNNWNDFLNEQTEPFQKKMKAKHPRLKNRVIGHGGQQNTPPFTEKPSMKRSKSAPPIGEQTEIDEGVKDYLKGAALGAGYGLYESMQPKGPELAVGGIVTRTTRNATIGEAGPEAVVPLDKFNTFMDNMLKSNSELISAVKQGGNVYIDNRMAGTATALGTYKI